MGPTDIDWTGLEWTRLFRGIELPPRDRLRASLAGLAATPSVGRLLDPAGGRWRPLAPGEIERWLDRVLITTPEASTSVRATIERHSRALGDVPFRVVTGTDWLLADLSHGYVDDWAGLRLIGELLRRAGQQDAHQVLGSTRRPGSGAPVDLPWVHTTTGRRDLAVLRQVARSPQGAVRAFAHRHALRGGTFASPDRTFRTLVPAVVHRSTPAGFMTAVRQQRDATSPGGSAAATILVGLRTALAEELPMPRPGVEVVFNNRSRSWGTAEVFGNWSSAVFLVPADDTSPASLSTAIRQARADAWPAAALGVSRVRGRHRRGRTEPRRVASRTGSPRLALSYVTARQAADQIPCLTASTEIATRTVPNGLDTIAIAAYELGDRLHLSASMFDEVWDSEVVARALDRYLATVLAFTAGREPLPVHLTGADRPPCVDASGGVAL